MKKNKYFLKLSIALGILFLVDCFSIIFCVINSSAVSEAKKVEHFMGFSYLFIHMLLIVFAFYFAFKAYMQKSQIIEVIMTNEKGEKNKKAYVRAIVFASIFGVVAVYFALLTFGVNLPLSFFSLGLKSALMNVGITICTVGIFLALYKPTGNKLPIE